MPWTIPAIVFLIVAALRGGGGSLADAAMRESIRRALMPPATKSLTMADLPPAPAQQEVVEPEAKPTEPRAKESEPPAKPDEPPSKPPELTESDWRAKMTAARSALERDEVLAEGMQGRVNGLITQSINMDDPAQRLEVLKQRDRAQAEVDRLTQQIEKDKLEIANIEEDARKKGIPPGWIR
jgi:hypothetical protein